MARWPAVKDNDDEGGGSEAKAGSDDGDGESKGKPAPGSQPLRNLVLLCGEACAIFARSLAPASVDEVFINYPGATVQLPASILALRCAGLLRFCGLRARRARSRRRRIVALARFTAHSCCLPTLHFIRPPGVGRVAAAADRAGAA